MGRADVPVQGDISHLKGFVKPLGGQVDKGIEFQPVVDIGQHYDLMGIGAIDAVGFRQQQRLDPVGQVADHLVDHLLAEDRLELQAVFQGEEHQRARPGRQLVAPGILGQGFQQSEPVGPPGVLVMAQQPVDAPQLGKDKVAEHAAEKADQGEKTGAVKPVEGLLGFAGPHIDGHKGP